MLVRYVQDHVTTVNPLLRLLYW